MKKNNTAGKILYGVLTVLVALVPAKAAIVLTGCPTTTNNNGTETPQPPVDLPRDQSAQIDLFGALGTPSHRVATITSHMTDADFAHYSAEIVRVLNETLAALNPAGGIHLNVMNQFGQEGGVRIIIEIDPTDFNLWKTNGDGRTVHLSNRVAKLNETNWAGFLSGLAGALRDNAAAADGDLIAMLPKEINTPEAIAGLSAMEMRAIVEERGCGRREGVSQNFLNPPHRVTGTFSLPLA